MTPADVTKALSSAGSYEVAKCTMTATGTVSAADDKLKFEVPGTKLALNVTAKEGKDAAKSKKAVDELKKASAKKGASFTLTGEASESGLALDSFKAAEAKKK